MARRGIAAGLLRTVFVFAVLHGAAQAEALRVAPVLLDVAAPQQATSLKVWNAGSTPIDVQVRILKWSQVDGADVLEATADVVVSPPIATLPPGSESVVRIVRVSGAAVSHEESYRLLVDQLPDRQQPQPGVVSLVLRQSIPVFFTPGVETARVAWRARREGDKIRLIASNSGGRRLRVANLDLAASGRSVGQSDGLVGYVLSGASASWLIPLRATPAPGQMTITAESETGRFDAIALPADR